MRRLLSLLGSALTVGALVIIPACGTFGVVVGSGDLTTQDFALSDFIRVQAENAFSIEIQQAAAFSVKVTIDDNLLDYLQVSKNGDTLVLSVRSGYSYPNSTFRAQVTMPDLRELRLSGAARAAVSGFAARKDLKVNASGASSASFLGMQVGVLTIDISGASSNTGEISADGNATLKLSGASTVELSGRAGDLDLQASGASQARLGGFSVGDAHFSLSGASQGTVNAAGTLSGNVSGASHLTYLGSPTLGNISTSGGSYIGKG